MMVTSLQDHYTVYKVVYTSAGVLFSRITQIGIEAQNALLALNLDLRHIPASLAGEGFAGLFMLQILKSSS